MTPIDVEICSTENWQTGFPAEALASGAISFRPVSECSGADGLFSSMQKVAQLWESKGINNYFIYTKSGEAVWEMVPYPGSAESTWDKTYSFVRQVEVLSRVVWGRSTQQVDSAQAQAVADFKPSTPEPCLAVKGSDVFCKKEVIRQQQITKAEGIRLLHDYAPLGADKLHFLLVPKAHKERFTHLSCAEFQAIYQTAQQITALYPSHICYMYHKTGVLAGQTVPHVHFHLVFVKPQDEWQGQCAVFARMLMPPTPLSPDELANRISAVKAQLEGCDK